MTTIVSAVVLTAGLVAQMTGGRLTSGDPSRVFEGVSTDSRSIPPGALFIALSGERFDGHAFLGAALARGAGGVLVSRTLTADVSGVAVIAVPDTLAALQAIGRGVRRASGARVIAVTGSAGKTTTKEITADLLATRYRVFRNRGNLNNHIGLPLSLVELRTDPDVAVVELGMNHAGEIRTLVGIAEPDVRMWTNVGDAHLGHFGSAEAIADAKAEILEQADARTLAVVNADDARVMARIAGFPGRVVRFGEAAGAEVRATRVVDRGFDGTSARVETAAGPMDLEVPLPGRAQLSNVLAAVGVAVEFGIAPHAIAQTIAGLSPVARRGQTSALAHGARLVDDSYNASPAAVRAMLAALAATPTTGRRVAVLGEMLELGDASYALHETCGRAAAAAGVDELVVVGGLAADGFAAGAIAAGLPASRVHRFATSDAAAAVVPSLVHAGDLVLVKGSRGTNTDVIAERLREAGS